MWLLEGEDILWYAAERLGHEREKKHFRADFDVEGLLDTFRPRVALGG